MTALLMALSDTSGGGFFFVHERANVLCIILLWLHSFCISTRFMLFVGKNYYKHCIRLGIHLELNKNYISHHIMRNI